jgi:hypothetical protein
MATTARPEPADCTYQCVNATTPRSSCSHDCPDHGAAHRRVPAVDDTQAAARLAQTFARIGEAPSDEIF